MPFLGATTSATIKPSEISGHDLVETNLAAPFDRMLIRRKGANRVGSSMAVLVGDGTAPEDFPATVQLAWDRTDVLADFACTPEAVISNWNGKFQFATEDEAQGIAGLRAPQIGALHAISAHFAVGSQFEPATVVLPTGTGKTETMLATSVYRRLKRTMVLVPSVALRSQIAGKFSSLGVLPDAGIVPQEIARPRVAALTAGVRTREDAETLLREANVIVALADYRAQVGRSEMSLDLLNHVADRYAVSRTAAAIKWLDFTYKRAMLVVATNGFVLWCWRSKAAKRSRLFFERGMPLPDGSLAANRKRSEKAGDLGVTLAPNTWPVNSEVREMAILADNYEMTISLLIFEDAPERAFGFDEDIDEDVFDRFSKQMR